MGLCNGKPITLCSLFDEHFLYSHDGPDRKAKKAIAIPYPHDIELRKFLPEMFEIYQSSSFFADNLLLPITDVWNKWPSLFFGAKGTGTKTHVDAGGCE